MIFHKGMNANGDSNTDTTETARDETITMKEQANSIETVNDEERSKTLVSTVIETKVVQVTSEDYNSRNDSINTLNSVSDIAHSEADLENAVHEALEMYKHDLIFE
ncbi:hypothetical protein ACO0OE_001464 [Hanseniaspora uvarum]